MEEPRATLPPTAFHQSLATGSIESQRDTSKEQATDRQSEVFNAQDSIFYNSSSMMADHPGEKRFIDAAFLVRLNERAMHAIGQGQNDLARKNLKVCEQVLNRRHEYNLAMDDWLQITALT